MHIYWRSVDYSAGFMEMVCRVPALPTFLTEWCGNVCVTVPFCTKSEWKNTFSLFDLRILWAPLKPCNFFQTSPLIQRIHTAAASPERRIFSPLSTSNWIKARALLFLPDWKQASSINSIMRFSPNDCPIRHELSFSTRSFDFTSMCPAHTSQVIMSELMSCVVIGFQSKDTS